MSKYQLSPDQIEDRISLLGSKYGNGAFLKDVRQLLEEATGEKIPEPFDEALLTHGSIWMTGQEQFLMVCHNVNSSRFTALFLPNFEAATSSPFAPNTEREEVLSMMRRDNSLSHRSWHRVGTYDFTAGLPKEAA